VETNGTVEDANDDNNNEVVVPVVIAPDLWLILPLLIIMDNPSVPSRPA
jgi:hypothetical protein